MAEYLKIAGTRESNIARDSTTEEGSLVADASSRHNVGMHQFFANTPWPDDLLPKLFLAVERLVDMLELAFELVSCRLAVVYGWRPLRVPSRMRSALGYESSIN
ncbi:hypothetical protein Taro_052546 [Colocasia esculenta]|uniref:Uncharacterized protein n=1 Tax=Colocasia esculenta TaxID=4460 RepID=A0A843XK89_COLES|nr:hypothetical protein [Colocasia esculenta]